MDIVIEQVAIKYAKDAPGKERYDRDYWTLDLNENLLDYDPEYLNRKFIGRQIQHQGYLFEITEVQFYSLRKDKVILTAIKK